MRFGRRQPDFSPPDNFPNLTELQAAMLSRIAAESTYTDIRYSRLMKDHVLPLPQGVPVDAEGRLKALKIAQSIAMVQRLMATTGVLWMRGLPSELHPGNALAGIQQAGYSCVAIASSDTLPETVLSLEEYKTLRKRHFSDAWFRAVNNWPFPDPTDERIGVLLATATATATANS